MPTIPSELNEAEFFRIALAASLRRAVHAVDQGLDPDKYIVYSMECRAKIAQLIGEETSLPFLQPESGHESADPSTSHDSEEKESTQYSTEDAVNEDSDIAVSDKEPVDETETEPADDFPSQKTFPRISGFSDIFSEVSSKYGDLGLDTQE